MKYLLIILSFFAVANGGNLCAQKKYKPIKTYLKNKNGTEALKAVEELRKDSVLCEDPKLYEYGKQAQILINNVENEKAYLKQQYDTARFFNSVLGIYDYILLCNAKEQHLLATRGKKMKYARENQSLLHRYFNNLNAGARFFYRNKKYAEAMPLLKHCVEVPQMAIWGSDKSATRDSLYLRNAYLHLRSSYQAGKFKEAFAFKDLLLADSTRLRERSLMYLTLSAEASGDSSAYTTYLETGLMSYPRQSFFFTRWADYWASKGDFKLVLLGVDSLLRIDSTNVVLWEGRSLALLNLQRYEEAVEAAKHCLSVDSSAVEANYYVGAAYCNLASNVAIPGNVGSKTYKQAQNKRSGYYRLARPYVERYRALRPEEKQRWAPLLYRIYFSLNLGAQFDEIDRLLNEPVKTPEQK